ncbi:MAG: hypothetical protein AAF092_09850 [Pseudomonadota bacterium]
MRSVPLSATMIGTLTLSACASDPLQAYPEAQSARDCEVLAKADENARRRAVQSQPSSGNWIADLLAGGVGAGVIEAEISRNLDGCLSRVGGQPVQATGQSAPGAFQPAAAPVAFSATQGCVPGAGVMQKGSLLCPGH